MFGHDVVELFPKATYGVLPFAALPCTDSGRARSSSVARRRGPHASTVTRRTCPSSKSPRQDLHLLRLLQRLALLEGRSRSVLVAPRPGPRRHSVELQVCSSLVGLQEALCWRAPIAPDELLSKYPALRTGTALASPVSVHGRSTSPGVPPILKRQSAFEAFPTITASVPLLIASAAGLRIECDSTRGYHRHRNFCSGEESSGEDRMSVA